MGLHVAPSLAETSHCTLGAGKPEAAASKVAPCPTSTVASTGCSVTLGGFSTVRVAGLLVALPATFWKLARYLCPLSDTVTSAMASWSLVAPATGLQMVPPLVETSHCTVGAGKPDAAASKMAVWPSSTIGLSGCSVTAGAL